MHHLNMDSTYRLIKQSKRSFALRRQIAITEEIQKLIDTEFIRKVNYPDWLANVMLVKKASGKW